MHQGREASRRDFLKAAAATVAGARTAAASQASSGARPPNFVIIFLDDSGWGDFQPFASAAYKTPNVARLAREGCRFTHFYVPSAVCSASRAALLSGCYPGRTGVFGAHGPNARGLDPKYATIGEVLKKRGYATAVFGKWHIGDQPETRPWARGFDESCGLMYSNDMWEFHPVNPERWGEFPLQFWEGDRVKIERVTHDHQPMLTTWYTEHAVDFIGRHRARPFFLYVPHSMPHVPIYASEKFRGKSPAGLYGDVIMEIDWSVGEIMKALDAAGVEESTLVILTSDNGPWITYGNHAGKTPFRESKGTSFDGGIRSACIMKFPGRIAAGTTSTRTLFTIDLLPTLAHLAGADLPENPIDGRNIWPLIRGDPDARNPHDYYTFGMGARLDGVISGDGRWKLHIPHPYHTLIRPGRDGRPGETATRDIGLALFDMENDPFETTSVLERHPDVATRLKAFADRHEKEFHPRQED